MEKIFKIGATIILFASIITPTAAIAEGSTLGDSVATYKEVAPNLFAQTELDNTVEVVEDPIDQTVTIEDDRTVTTSDNVSISFSGNGQEALESNGIGAYDDSSRASSQLIQPLSEGFRVIRILENSQASEDYTYEISIPKGAVLEPVFGSIRVVRGDEIIGSLKTPWALDALGNELPTSYTLDGFGSYIIFQLAYSSTGRPQLTVDAYIVKDLQKAANDLNASLAWDKWFEFATNLNK